MLDYNVTLTKLKYRAKGTRCARSPGKCHFSQSLPDLLIHVWHPLIHPAHPDEVLLRVLFCAYVLSAKCQAKQAGGLQQPHQLVRARELRLRVCMLNSHACVCLLGKLLAQELLHPLHWRYPRWTWFGHPLHVRAAARHAGAASAWAALGAASTPLALAVSARGGVVSSSGSSREVRRNA